jgi:hypothetical protein
MELGPLGRLLESRRDTGVDLRPAGCAVVEAAFGWGLMITGWGTVWYQQQPGRTAQRGAEPAPRGWASYAGRTVERLDGPGCRGFKFLRSPHED